MATRLDKAIRRELELDDQLYTVLIDPEGVKITEKGKRTGHTLSWKALLSGEAELTRSLKMSLDALGAPAPSAVTVPRREATPPARPRGGRPR